MRSRKANIKMVEGLIFAGMVVGFMAMLLIMVEIALRIAAKRIPKIKEFMEFCDEEEA